MTQTQDQPAGRCPLPPPGWLCDKDAGHDGPCAAHQQPAEQPTPAGPEAPLPYGFRKPGEVDLHLPSGGFVRVRKLTIGRILDFQIVDIADAFTAELLADIDENVDEDTRSNTAVIKALSSPESAAKIIGPVNKVVLASVICPKVVETAATTDEWINIDDIDVFDKLTIFEAAIGEQLAAIKSFRSQT